MGAKVWQSRHELTAEGARINVHRTGAGPTAFVLIHGIGASPRYFEPLAAALAGEASVYAVELPGFGSVPKPDHALSIEEFAAVVGSALVQLGVDRAVVVGHSMGAQIAAALAVRAPERVSRLVLLGPTVNDRRRSAFSQAMMLGLDTLREKAIVNWIVFTDYLRAGMPWYLRILPKMLENRIETTLFDVTCPVNLVRGERDPIAPGSWLERIRRNCPQAVITQVPDQPHVVMYGDPYVVAQLCLEKTAPL